MYSGRVEENIFYLHIADSSKSRLGNQRSNQAQLYINKIQSIDFRRGEKGEGRLLVFLKENSSAVNVAEKDGKVVVEFYNTDIPDDLLYQLDVMDFGTVVKGIETFKEGAVTPTGD